MWRVSQHKASTKVATVDTECQSHGGLILAGEVKRESSQERVNIDFSSQCFAELFFQCVQKHFLSSYATKQKSCVCLFDPKLSDKRRQ